MKKYDVTIARQAERDLREIFEYIAFELLAPENAAAQIDRLEATIAKLDIFPQRHRLHTGEPWCSRGLRVLSVDNYVVFYIPDDSDMVVTVIRVMYGGRDIDAHLNKFARYEK